MTERSEDDAVRPVESLSRKEKGRFAQLAASLRDRPACVEQRRTVREANAAWSVLSQQVDRANSARSRPTQ